MIDPVLKLVEDLTSRLSATATEFETRVASIARAVPDTAPTDGDLRDMAKRLIAERKLRRTHLPTELFSEPAWDMLLALFVAHAQPDPVNVKCLVAAADAPITTSQRWIEHLHRLGLVDRVIDPNDRRRIELSLNDAGYVAMADYLAALI